MYIEKRNPHSQIMEIVSKQGGPYTKTEQDDRRKKYTVCILRRGFLR